MKRVSLFLGLRPEEAIGQTPPDLFNRPTTIVGVIKDFHYESLHRPIGPQVFHNGNGMGRTPFLLISLNTNDLRGVIARLENTFKEHVPNSAFDFEFLDDHLETLYSHEKSLSGLILIFTIFSVLISCLGLLALAVFSAQRRIKEIGIRKILGASIQSIMGLLARDFTQPVIFAIVVAIPISYWAIQQWMNDFAYHTSIDWWVFALAGIGSIVLALLTISSISVKAATQLPMKSIRDE